MIRISGNPLRGCKDGERAPPVHSCGAVLWTSQQSWENRKPCTANQSQGEIPTTWKMAKIVTMLVTRNRRANALPAASWWCRSRAIRLHVPLSWCSGRCRPLPVEDRHNSRVGQVPHDTLASGEDHRALTEPEAKKDIPTQDDKPSMICVGSLSLGKKVFQAQGHSYAAEGSLLRLYMRPTFPTVARQIQHITYMLLR